MDYGYPLWSELKEQMLNFDIEAVLKDDLQLDHKDLDQHRTAYAEFRRILESEPNATLDSIAAFIDKPKTKHLAPTGHLLINLAGYLLAQVERKGEDGKWVTEFQKLLVDLLAQGSSRNPAETNHLANLSVISLNYDRVFEHYISRDFYRALLDHAEYEPPDLRFSISLSRENQLSVMKPHGYITALANQNSTNHVGMLPDLMITGNNTLGLRYPGNDHSIAYQDPRICEKEAFLRMGRHMYVVDERDSNDYSAANDAVSCAEQVFCLGLSPAGICQSKIVFREDQAVYLSNKGSEIPEIEESKGPADFETLGSDSKRLCAIDFVGKFKDFL